MKKGSKAGYVLQMICGIGMTLYAIVYIAGVWTELVVYLAAALLFIAFAVLGKKRVWPNVVNLILTLFPLYGTGLRLGRALYVSIGYGEWYYFTDWYFYLRCLLPFIFCLLGFIGTIVGIENVSKQKKAAKAENAGESAALASDSTSSATLPPLKAKLLRKREGTVARFHNESGEELVLDLVDAVYFKENGSMQLYAILRREGGQQLYVAQYHDESDTMSLIDGEEAERVLAEWKKGADSPQKNGAVQRAGKRLKLDIVDTIVHRADWKAFRKRASQDELFALAVGSRYQLDGAKPFVKTFLAVAGAILAIVLMVSMEFGQIGIIGGVAAFFACNFIACKQLGYYNTLNDCRWKLDNEHSQLLNDLFPENIFVTILRWLFMILLMIITTPYQAILMFIEVLIPAARNWTVAHGGNAGAVISMPKGCDIGGLGAMGAYYASQKFGDVWDQHLQEVEAAKLAKFQKYTYTDQYGMTQEAYSDDGKTFYEGTNKLKEVGTSKDGGKTIKLK